MIAAPIDRASCERGSHNRAVCPSCQHPLIYHEKAFVCTSCQREFLIVAGIPDLRLASDRYLPIFDEREKARALDRISTKTDFEGLCRAYYALTPDVDEQRASRFLRHLGNAEYRANSFVDLLPSMGPVLEVGCGTGGMLKVASRRGTVITGVDIALRWLMIAKKRLESTEAILLGANAEHLPWTDSSFSAIYADSVLEHLDNPELALQEWRRVAKPGAPLILVSPNRWSCLRDPHVGLWGLGFLPRRWQKAYVRRRRNTNWAIQPLSARQARELAIRTGWENVRVEAAPAPQVGSRVARALYEFARGLRVFSPLLRQFGPLWLLTATRGEVA